MAIGFRMRGLLLAAFLLAGFARAGEEEEFAPSGAPDRRGFFVVEEFGRVRERGRYNRRAATHRGRPVVVVDTDATTRLERDGRLRERRVRRRTVTAHGGTALRWEETVLEGDERSTLRIDVSEGVARFAATGPAGKENADVPVPPGTLFDLGPEYILAQGPKVGRVYERPVLDVRRRAVRREAVTLVDYDPEGRVWIGSASLDDGEPLHIEFSSEGELLRIEGDGFAYRAVDRREFEDAERRPAARVTSTLPTGFRLPAWDGYAQMELALAPVGAWPPFVVEDVYARLGMLDGRLVATLIRNAPPEAQGARYPPEPSPEAFIFLQPAPDVPSTDPALVRIARRETEGETLLLPALAKLAGWVNATVKFGAGANTRIDPRVVLETRSGDCTGHAALMATLCRAAGIPARRCLGLIVKEDRLVYHAWVEAWAEGVWMPVDTTVNRVGLPAGYLLTRREDENGEWADPFAWRLREGGLEVSLLSAAMETPGRGMVSFVPGNPATYRVAEGDWRADLYWGFTLRTPRGWTAAPAEPGRPFTFTHDDGARLTAEALDVAWKATAESVDRLALQLSKVYANFRRRGGGVTTMADGAHALALDFTCQEGGAPLRATMVLIPRRGRTIRATLWAPPAAFGDAEPVFRRFMAAMTY